LLQNFDLSKNFFCVFCGPVELLEDSGEPLWRVDTSLEKTQKNTTPENERLEPKNHPEMKKTIIFCMAHNEVFWEWLDGY